jgi:hypothetical protein
MKRNHKNRHFLALKRKINWNRPLIIYSLLSQKKRNKYPRCRKNLAANKEIIQLSKQIKRTGHDYLQAVCEEMQKDIYKMKAEIIQKDADIKSKTNYVNRYAEANMERQKRVKELESQLADSERNQQK